VDTLPVLISIPHGGTQTPAELEDRLLIGEKGIFEDTDPFTQQIYDLGEKAKYVVKAAIARAFVDPSRSVSDLPPDNPDGVVKSHTCFGKIIYKHDLQPTKSEIRSLLDKYYHPFHNQLQAIIHASMNDLELCLDCHSMAETGPAIAPDTGKKRPVICLGNRFGEASPNEIIHKLRSCFMIAFDLDETEVTINKPFAGGFITRHYGNNPLPWIQVEMNRKLYLEEPHFNSETLEISAAKTEELNGRFYLALKNYFS
jgi:N-formylglutamate deformylase